MATKEQERKALEQIKKIVAGLGEESYIGKALEGCFEVAQDNIENDFWNSNKDKVETLSTDNWNKRKEIAELKKQNNDLKARAEEAESLFNQKCETATKYYTAWKDSEDRWVKVYNEQADKAFNANVKVEALEAEVIKLKAKLYDLMVADK